MGQMIANMQMKCCNPQLYKEKQQIQEDIKTNRNFIQMNEDYQYFQEECWYQANDPQLFDIEKGIPCKLMRQIILDIFKKTYQNCNLDYEIVQRMIFKNQVLNDLKYVPLFQDSDLSPQEVLKCQVLNQNGITALIKILHTLRGLYHQLTFNPMVIQVIALLLIFCKESETFTILEFLIQDSKKLLDEKQKDQGNDAQLQRSLRWHFMMTKEDFTRYTKSFIETVTYKSATFSEVISHFNKIRFDYHEYFQEITFNLLQEHLPFWAILQIFILFLNEGIKIYFRMVYALMRNLKESILKQNDSYSMRNTIRKAALQLGTTQVEEIIKRGFKLRLNSVFNPLSKIKVGDGEIKVNEMQHYYYPSLDVKSQILKDTMLETLWPWLPHVAKSQDGIQIWNTEKDGTNLGSLYIKLAQQQAQFMLVFIETTNQEIFGFFADSLLKLTNQTKYFGGNQTFVFSLFPEIQKYNSSGLNDNYLYTCKEYFTVGSEPEGPAIQLDSEMNKGRTYYSQTFNNKSFLKNFKKHDFKCLHLEIYIFD